MAVADALPVGQVMKLRHVKKILRAANGGKPLSSLSFDQLRRFYTQAGLKGYGEHLHHTVPLKASKLLPKAERSAAGVLRNDPALLKVLDPATHRFVHSKQQGFDRARQLWHATNALEKTVAGAAVTRAADAGEAAIERRDPSSIRNAVLT